MAAQVALNPYPHQKMAIKHEVPNEVNYNVIKNFSRQEDSSQVKQDQHEYNRDKYEEYKQDKHEDKQDESDNKPSSYYIKRGISDENARNRELFDIMKYEVNRLNSFSGKWPLSFIKPKDLAQNGFFYLQSEDQVQCAFCGVIINEWVVGEKPMKKHMVKSPRCIFFRSVDGGGNVPLTKPKAVVKNVNISVPNGIARNTLSNKPKYPQMSDIRNRIRTYRGWPLLTLSDTELADCGLFWTGVSDICTCYYCGNSLGNWQKDDIPVVEHEKFFPNCGHLELLKTRKQAPSFAPVKSTKLNSASAASENSVLNQVIRQACEIFPDSLVQKVAILHFQKTGRHFTSMHDLCEAILEFQAQNQSVSTHVKSPVNNLSLASNLHKTVSVDETSKKAPAENTNRINITCKVCLDEDINIVFEPCHHQVACEKCAQRLTKCPLCRSVITNRIKVFWG